MIDFHQWRDRPWNALWFALAVFAAYGVSEVIRRLGWMPMPQGASLTSTFVVWRWVVPIIIGGFMIWFLMRTIRKNTGQQVFIDRHDTHGNHGPF